MYTHVHTCIHVCTGLVDCTYMYACTCVTMCVLNQLSSINYSRTNVHPNLEYGHNQNYV